MLGDACSSRELPQVFYVSILAPLEHLACLLASYDFLPSCHANNLLRLEMATRDRASLAMHCNIA